MEYLGTQGEHHGYAHRARPPIFVQSFTATPAEEGVVRAKHAYTQLQFHLVLATWQRRGVFGPGEAQVVADCWRLLQTEHRFALAKVSFVPDHVHAAVWIHPGVSPSNLVAALMNCAQETLFERCPDAMIAAGAERPWQPSAYIGSFGDLATPQTQRYIQNWQTRAMQGD
jgi:REP element-mobilizing transposase RayT